MRVGSAGSFDSYRNNFAHNKTSFKADVRVATGFRADGGTMPEEQAKSLFQSLVHAMKSYKDKGSDNILIYLKPVFTPGSWGKKPKSNIEILAMYKDADKAAEEIKENIKNNPEAVLKPSMSSSRKAELKEEIKLLDNPTDKVRDYYKNVIYTHEAYTPLDKMDTVTPECLDKAVNNIIDKMTYQTPIIGSNETAPFCWTKKNPFIRPEGYCSYEEDKIEEKLFANYPQWEKDLWDELNVDFRTEIKQYGRVFTA